MECEVAKETRLFGQTAQFMLRMTKRIRGLVEQCIWLHRVSLLNGALQYPYHQDRVSQRGHPDEKILSFCQENAKACHNSLGSGEGLFGDLGGDNR
jgi:hypothetical protein